MRRLGRGDAVWISGFFRRDLTGQGPFYVSGIAESERMMQPELPVELTALEPAP